MIYRFSSSLKKVFFSWRVDVGRGQRSSVTFSHRVEKNNRVTILPFKSGRFLFFFSFLLFFFLQIFMERKVTRYLDRLLLFRQCTWWLVWIVTVTNLRQTISLHKFYRAEVFFFLLLFCDTFVITVFGRLFYKLNIAYKR